MANNNSKRKQSGGNSREAIKDILVVGFTSEIAYQFLRIRQRREGDIYIENRYRPRGPHFSYHASGEMHEVYINHQGKRIQYPRGKGPPIAQFRGEQNLDIWLIVPPTILVSKRFIPSKDKKSQVLLCLDMSRLSGQLSLNIRLLESGRIDLLQVLLQKLKLAPIRAQVWVIPNTNPWTIIIAALV